MNVGRVVEVFHSLQGEGPRVGEPQIFARLGGCNLRCDYCDEPHTIPKGAGEPWSAARLKAAIEALAAEHRCKIVSWTGGEPLMQARFLGPLLAWSRAKGFENCLETNAVLCGAFRAIGSLVDFTSADVKFPSAARRELWRSQGEFLRLIPAGKGCVKAVLTARTTEAEFRRCLRLARDNAPSLPLFLQPATAALSAVDGKTPVTAPSRARIARFFRLARAAMGAAEVLAQQHPRWGLQ